METRITVLLVDDHPVVREGLQAMLETTGDIAVVGQAGDGLEAVAQVAEHRPQVVLMDLRMPSMDGLEATRRIKREFPETSVIVLTVYEKDAFVVGAVRAGASGYLLKDASRELLIHAIHAAQSGGMLIRSSLLRQAMAQFDEAKDADFGLPLPGVGDLEPGDPLTTREQEVLCLLVEGSTNKEIGQALFMSEDTVKKHVQSIIAKLGTSDRTQAAVRAVRLGLVA